MAGSRSAIPCSPLDACHRVLDSVLTNTPGADPMGHPPFPPGATGREIRLIQGLHQFAIVHREPEVRSALAGAVELIAELIEDRGRRRDLAEQWEAPHD